jgi:RNase P subunit RPR2
MEMKKQIIMRIPKTRAVTESLLWIDAPIEDQHDTVRELACEQAGQKTRLACFVEDQIKKKIAGYKSQDVKKGFYEPDQIMDVSGVLSSLVHCDFQCYYCKECVMVLYRNAREPRQWTLERLDNSQGHNRDNVVIACLQCNLTRKTMYHERFMFTKQLEIVKL